MAISNKEAAEYVNKHVDLILCANNMTLVQRKTFNFLLHHAMPNLAEKELFHVRLKEIAKKIGYTSRDFLALAEIIDKLGDLRIKCKIMDSKTSPEDMISVNIAPIPTIVIKDGICSYRYNPDIVKQLSRPSIYGRLNLAIQASLKSTFGLILYEICEKYKAIGHTGWIEITALRELMGVPKSSYKLFADFEKRVLQKAMDEVNLRTQFNVIYEIERQGKAVNKIKFIILKLNSLNHDSDDKESSDVQSHEISTNEYNQILSILLEEFNVHERVAQDLLNKYSFELLARQIEIIKSSPSFKAGTIRNIAGLLVKAVQNNYKPAKSSKDLNRISQAQKAKEEVLEQTRGKEQEKQKNNYLKYLRKEVDSYLESIADNSVLIDEIREGFINYCYENNWHVHLKNYKKNYDHKIKIVRPAFDRYIINTRLFDSVKNEASFCEYSMELSEIE